MLSNEHKRAMEQGFREEMERQLDASGVTDPRVRQEIIANGLTKLAQEAQQRDYIQNTPKTSATKKGCFGCFGCFSILACITLFFLWVISLDNNLSGNTYKRIDGRASYEFVRDEVHLSVIPSQSLMEAKLPVVGETLFTFGADPSAEATVYVTLSSSVLGRQVRFFVLPNSMSYQFYSTGKLVKTDLSPVTELYASSDDINRIKEQFLEIVEHRIGTPNINACFYSAGGEKLLYEKALPDIVQSLKDNISSNFCIVLPCDTRTVYRQGQSLEIATIPVEYDKTTVTLNWAQAKFADNFQGKSLDEAKNVYGTANEILRIEDDSNFLFNPETAIRWKRE